MASTRFIGNPVYVVTDKAQPYKTYRVRAKSAVMACSKIARKTGKNTSDYRTYQF